MCLDLVSPYLAVPNLDVCLKAIRDVECQMWPWPQRFEVVQKGNNEM